jgi:hypothetical protein
MRSRGGGVLPDLGWVPTFAFLDPHAAEIHWERWPAQHGSKFKVELWLLFAHAQLPRAPGVNEGVTYDAFAPKTTRLFGCEDWIQIHQARRLGMLGPDQ